MGDVGILSVAAVDNADNDVEGNPSNPLDDEIPATCPSEYLINVTNTTSEDLKYTNPAPNRGAAYSDTHVDLGAPGTSIISTLPDDTYGYYQGGTGTSFAAPHVAGAIALMHAAAPPSVVAYYKSHLGPGALQFKEVLLESADSKSGLVGEVVNGRRLNVKNAVAAMVDADDDGIVDMLDNCSDDPNTGQDDTDGDDCGNLCDCDYDQNGTCGFDDFLQFAGAFGTTTDPEKCHEEPIPGCTVGFNDFLFFAGGFGGAPGPSGTTAGTTACP
jgi:subtilisin family serine protease